MAFDPEKYLEQVEPKQADFDPSAYLQQVEQTPASISSPLSTSDTSVPPSQPPIAQADTAQTPTPAPLDFRAAHQKEIADYQSRVAAQTPEEREEVNQIENPTLLHIPKLQGNGVGAGIARGLASGVEGLTSPGNIALMATLGGAPGAIQKAAALGFTAMMAKDVPDKIIAGKQAYDAGNHGDAAEAWTGAAIDTLLTALTIGHSAARGEGSPAFLKTKEALRSKGLTQEQVDAAFQRIKDADPNALKNASDQAIDALVKDPSLRKTLPYSEQEIEAEVARRASLPPKVPAPVPPQVKTFLRGQEVGSTPTTPATAEIGAEPPLASQPTPGDVRASSVPNTGRSKLFQLAQREEQASKAVAPLKVAAEAAKEVAPAAAAAAEQSAEELKAKALETQPEPGTKVVGPAITDEQGNILAKGEIGTNHGQLKTGEIAKGNVEAADASHVFVDDKGNVLNREQAWELAKKAGQIPQETLDSQARGEIGPELHSEHLSEGIEKPKTEIPEKLSKQLDDLEKEFSDDEPAAPVLEPAPDTSAQETGSEPKSFAQEVEQAAANTRASKVGWFGNRKILINKAWEAWQNETGKTMSLEDFKRELLKSQRNMGVELSRADYPVGVDKGDLAASHTKYGDEDYHFITTDKEAAPVEPKKTPSKEETITALKGELEQAIKDKRTRDTGPLRKRIKALESEPKEKESPKPESFSDQVKSAAASIPGDFGDEKRLISNVYDAFVNRTGSNMSLEEFKKNLMPNLGDIDLSPFDLIGSKPLGWSDKSATGDDLSTYHFIREAPLKAEPVKEIWEKTREEAKDEGILAKHRLAVKAAVAEGKPVPLEVLEDFGGSPWADKAIEKNYGGKASDSLLSKIEKALEDDPTKLFADPLLVQTVGKPVLRQAVKVIRASLEAGKLIGDAVEDAITYLKTQNPNIDEEKARTLFGNLVEQPQAKGGEISEERNQIRNEEKGNEGEVTPPGEGEKVPSQSPEPETAAAYNAETDKVLERGGFAPIAKEASKELGASWQEALDSVKVAADKGQDIGANLVKELNKKPRALTDVESGILLNELAVRKKAQALLQEQLEEDAKSGDTAAQAETAAQLAVARDKTFETIQAAKIAGREWGRAGRFRQIHIDDDYNIVSMEAKVRSEVNNGEPLKEKQIKFIEASKEEIEKAKKYDEMMESARRDAETATIADDLQKQVKEQAEQNAAKGKTFIDFIHDQAAKARARIIARRGSMYMAVEPITPIAARFVDETIIGASYIADKIVDFGRWSKKMVADFGPRISPHLPEIFKLASEKNDELSGEHETQNNPEKTPEKTVENIVAKQAGKPLSPQAVYELAKAHAQMGVGNKGGVEGMNELMKAVHKDLLPSREGLTEREVRDAFSGYGKVQHPSKEAVASQLREVRRLGQLQSGIEDALNKQAPKKSGMQRDKPTQAVREQMKTLQTAMRDAGIETTSPEQQLASVNAARERSISNRIEDIKKEIATGEKPPKGKPVADSPKVTELKAERDKLQKQLDEINEAKNPKKTPEQVQNEARTTALRKSIAELDARLKTGEHPLRKTPIPDSPEVESLRAERDSMRAQLDEIEAAENPPKDPATAALENAIKTTRKSIEKYDAMLKSGDVSPKESAPKFTPSDELEALQSERDALKQAVEEIRKESKPVKSKEDVAHQAALKSLNKRLAELERRLKTGDTSTKPKTESPANKFADVRAKRFEVNRLQETLNALKKQRDARSPEEIANQRYRSLLKNRTEELEARQKSGDFTKPVRNKLKLDKESEQAKADYERAKHKFDTEVEKQRRANLPPSQKFWNHFVAIGGRAGKLTSAAIFGKLGAAAVVNEFVLKPFIEEPIGGLVSKVLPKLADRAPIEGQFSLPAEIKAKHDFFTVGMDDALRNLKMQKSNLDEIYGHSRNRDIPPSWYEYSAFLHAASKASTKRAGFSRAELKQMEWKARTGSTLTNPNDMIDVGQRAYVEANRHIYNQDNAVAKGFAAFERTQEMNDNKWLSLMSKFFVPIRKIPTNLVTASVDRAAGLPIALVKTALAYKRGIESLTLDQGDTIMRQFKKGIPGAALLLFGYYKYKNIGGFHKKEDQRSESDIQPGRFRIPTGGGSHFDAPALFSHTDAAMVMNIGATVGWTEHERTNKGPRGLARGAVAGGMGLVSELPFVPIVTSMAEAASTQNGWDFFIQNLVSSTVVPGLVPQIARIKDTPGSLPKNLFDPPNRRKIGDENFGVVDKLKEGIPGLRETLPLKKSKRRYSAIR